MALKPLKPRIFFDLEQFSQIIDEPLGSIVFGDVEAFLGTIWFEFNCEEESMW
jgi:hypothetical protein